MSEPDLARPSLDGAMPMVQVDGPQQTMPAHRPSSFNGEIALLICERVEAGETLRSICDQKGGGMPSRSTVNRWLELYPDFAAAYARAMKLRTDGRMDEIYEAAKNAEFDFIEEPATEAGQKPLLVPNKTQVTRSKLFIDTLFRIMALESPKKYGIGDEPERNGDDAKDVTPAAPTFQPPKVIEHDPLYDAVQAWDRAAKGMPPA